MEEVLQELIERIFLGADTVQMVQNTPGCDTGNITIHKKLKEKSSNFLMDYVAFFFGCFGNI